jgi:hypothetical protein
MKQKISVAVVIALLLLLIVGATTVLVRQKVAEANEKTILALEAQVANQERLIFQIAELTKTSGADVITQKIVVDCSANERARFDSLLDSLSGSITQAEIKELDSLFYKCARFYADRKSVMAARLVREVEVFAEYNRLYQYIKNSDTDETYTRVVLWQQLAESEMSLAGHFNTLVALQGDIITALLNGQTKDSTDIKNTLVQVAETRDQMTMLTKQIENFQTELRSI